MMEVRSVVTGQRVEEGLSALRGPGGEVAVLWRDASAIPLRARVQPPRFEEIIQTLPLPVFCQDACGVFTGANAAFAAFVGVGPDEIPGGTAFDIWDASLAALSITTDAPLLAAPRKQTYECRARRGDGRPRRPLPPLHVPDRGR